MSQRQDKLEARFRAAKGESQVSRVTNWRDWLRRNTNNGAEIHEILLALARGAPKRIKLLDGKVAVIIPTAEVRARVAIHLDEMMHGKAVTQNEQQRAEREAGALAAVQALSDDVLAQRAAAALLRSQEGAGNALPPGESEAEIVEESEISSKDIWESVALDYVTPGNY